jgi:hypothetical protein
MTNTTKANHGRCRQKWPPSAPHEALCSAPTHPMDGWQPPEHADIIVLECGGRVWPSKHSHVVVMCIAGAKEHFEGHAHPQQEPKKLYPLAWGVVIHPFNVSASSARPHVGRLGAISVGGGHGCGGCDASCVMC